MASKKRPSTQTHRVAPNVDDPVSEPTVGRRLWAMYLSRGYNRNTWAKMMDVAYLTVDRWDMGTHLPHLDQLKRMSELLGYSLEEVAYGYDVPSAGKANPLSLEDKANLLRELRATPDQAKAFSDFDDSPAGRQLHRRPHMRAFIATFIEAYQTSRRTGATHVDAITVAKEVAANARANVEAVAFGAEPQSENEIAKVGERARNPKAKRKRKRAQ